MQSFKGCFHIIATAAPAHTIAKHFTLSPQPTIFVNDDADSKCPPNSARSQRCKSSVVEYTLGNAQRRCDLLVRQASVKLQMSYVFDLTHIDPWYGYAVSRQKMEAYPFGCYMRNTISMLHDTVPVSCPVIPAKA